MREKIQTLIKNKDAKTLMENFASLSVLQAVNILLPLITLPYVIRVFGFSNYGVIALAISLIAYFQPITDYSFRITAVRDTVIFKDSNKKLSLLYSNVITIKLILCLISSLVIVLIVFLYPPFFEHRVVFFLTIPMLLGYALFPEWFFQGIENMKYITILNVSIKAFFTACIFIFVKSEGDYWLYPLLNSLGYIGGACAALIILIKKYKLKLILVKPKTIKASLKSNFPIFINQFVPNLYNNTSAFLLGILTSTETLGIYDAIRKVSDFGISILGVFSRVFFPFINRKKHVFPRYLRLMIVVGLALTITPIIFHKAIFWYLNVSYENSFLILLLCCLSIFSITLYEIFGVNYFIVNRKDKIVMKNTLIASLTGLALAFPFIKLWSIIGAALILLLSRTIMGFGLTVLYIKEIRSNV